MTLSSTYNLKIFLLIFLFAFARNTKGQVTCSGAGGLEVNHLVDFNGEHISCAGSCDASIEVVFTGGSTGPFGYEINGVSQASNTVGDLCDGNYEIKVYDSSQVLSAPLGLYHFCKINAYEINEPDRVDVNVLGTSPPTCKDSCDGTFIAIIDGGTGNLTPTWVDLNGPGNDVTDPPTGSGSIVQQSGLCSNTYTLRVQDENGCVDEAVEDVLEPDAIIPNIVLTDANCDGDDDGSAISNASGGNGGPFTFLWDEIPSVGGISAINTVNGLIEGATYKLNLEDKEECPFETTFTTTDILPITVSIDPLNIEDASCSYKCDGSITLDISGGSGDYPSVKWFRGTIGSNDDTGITGETNDELCPDVDYYVVVTDNNNCEETIQLNSPISSADVINIALDNLKDINCHGDNDGEIEVTLTGGNLAGGLSTLVPTWTILTDGSGIIPNDEDQTGLGGGTYRLVVEDNAGCKDSADFPVDEPDTLIVSLSITNLIECNGDGDGELTATISGGIPNYDYDWGTSLDNNDVADIENIGLTNVQSSLLPDDYFLTVTDANGCEARDTESIEEPEPLNVNINITNTIDCNGDNDGELTAELTGGTANYDYDWGTSLDGTDIADIDNSILSNIQSNLVPNDYFLTVTDANGCQARDTESITEPQLLIVDISITNTINCNGEDDAELTAEISGGTVNYNYVWGTSLDGNDLDEEFNTIQETNIQSGLEPNDYFLTVSDANGCEARDTESVTEPPQIVANGTPQNLSCSGETDGQITLNPTGGTGNLSFTWNGPNGYNSSDEDIFALDSGTYELNIVDENNCPLDTSFTLTTPAPIFINGTKTNVSCFDENNGEIQIFPLTSASSGTICKTVDEGDVMDLAAPAGAVFTSVTFASYGLPTGSCGEFEIGTCHANSSLTILEAAIIGQNIASITADNTTFTDPCVGTVKILSVEVVWEIPNSFTFDWSGPDAYSSTDKDINLLDTGTYNLTITETATLCTKDTTISISQPNLITLSGVVTDILCNGDASGSIDVTYEGGNPIGGPNSLSPTWTIEGPGSGIVENNEDQTGLSGGIYKITVEDNNGCNKDTLFTVDEPDLLNVAITISNTIDCNGDNDAELTAEVTGGTANYDYDWGTSLDGNEIADVNNSESPNIQSNLAAPNDYFLTVTDANGCQARDTESVTEPEPLNVNITISNTIDCNGDNDAELTAEVTGGTANYDYDWGTSLDGNEIADVNNSESPNIQSNLAAPNDYFLTVTDANGCQARDSESITEPDPISVDVTITNTIDCNGDGDAELTAELTGGTANYNYDWGTTLDGNEIADIDNSGVLNSQSNLVPNNYFLTVTDANGCQARDTESITEPELLDVDITITQAILCNGVGEGELTATIVGGTANYNYDWGTTLDGNEIADIDNSGIINAQSNLITDDYFLTVIDANGCEARAAESITEPELLNVNITITNTIDCNSDGDAELTAEVTGGTANYNYDWGTTLDGTEIADIDNSGVSNSQSNLVPNDYFLTVTDANGCQARDTESITEPDLLNVDITITNIINCSGEGDAELTAEITGGTVNYNYVWGTSLDGNDLDEEFNTIQETNIQSGLEPNDYFLTVSDANGCEARDTESVTEPPQIVANGTPQNLSCSGETDGQITLNPTGGTGNLSFTWNGPNGYNSSDEDIFALDSGTYELNIVDENNCPLDTSFTLTTPTEIYISGSVTEISCADSLNGAIEINPFGGTNNNGYEFNWSGPSGFNSNGQNIENLGGGAYNIIITDDRGCEKDSSINVAIINPIAFNPVINQSNCGLDNGDITVAISGGNVPYDITWSNGETSDLVNDLFQGTYNISVSYNGNDGSVCIVDTNISLVDDPPAIDASFTPTNESCFGTCDGNISAAIINAAEPVIYSWTALSNPTFSGNNPDQFDLCSDIYYLEMTDANLCPYKDTIVISSADEIITTETITNVNCGGDSTGAISIIVEGGIPSVDGYLYNWIGENTGFISSSSDISNLVADNYYLTVTDSEGCLDTETYEVAENDAIIITSNSNPATCGENNGSADIIIDGGVVGAGYQIVWKDNSNSTIATNTTNIDNKAAGIYSATVTDDVGCTDSVVININDLSQSSITIDSIKHESCAGDQDGLIMVSLTILSDPPTYNLSWEGPDGFNDPGGNNLTIENLSSGQYIATLEDGDGCIVSEIIDINEAQSLTINAVIDSLDCFGDQDGEIDLFVSGGNITDDYTYDWGNDGVLEQQDTTGLAEGTYIVTVYDDFGCNESKIFTLLEPTELTGSTTSSLTGCGENDGSAEVTVSGGTVLTDYTYIWTNGDNIQVGATNIIENRTADCYAIQVLDDNGCEFNDIVCINNPDGPEITLESIDDVSCFGDSDGSIFISVNGPNTPFDFNWQTVTTGSANDEEDLQNVTQGTYSITVTDNLGCVKGETHIVNGPDDIELEIVKTDINCNGDNSGEIDLTINGGTPNFTINWTGLSGTFSSVEEDLENLSQGDYTISGSDSKGCPITPTTVTIEESTEITISIGSTPTACDENTGSIAIAAIGGTVVGDYTYQLTDVDGNIISTSSITQDLPEGEYIGYVFDDFLCSVSENIEVSYTDGPQIALTEIDNVSCAGDATGSIYITVTGTASPFSYQWSGTNSPDPAHQTVEDFENWFAGIYSVDVTDTNGCVTTLSDLTIGEPDPISVEEIISSPLCAGESTGSVVLNVDGGTGNYLYVWEEDGITIGNESSINALDSGSYTYTITDDNNCEVSNVVEITSPNSISLITNANQSTCGNSNGSATVTPSGGTPNPLYNYSWTNVVTGDNFGGSESIQNNLSSGVYEVVVTDGNFCSNSINITVSDSDGPLIEYVSSNIACFGSVNGTIDLTITGSPDYNFAWTGPDGFTDPGNVEDLFGLDPGDYSVFVTDVNNCSSAENITVAGPNGGIEVQSTIKDLDCYNDQSGEIAITVIGGTPNYTYSWTGPDGFSSTDEDLTNLDSGQYILDILDFNNCPLNGTVFDISHPSLLTLDTSIVQPTCDSTDGILSVIASGGTGEFSYVWDNISTLETNLSFTDSLKDIGAGNYEVRVTDENLCISSVVIAISDLNGPVLSETSNDVDCAGDNDGYIDLSVNPVGDYTYDWDNDELGDFDDQQDLTSLEAGNYNVVVKDLNNGCKSTLSININIANTLEITLAPSSLNCSGDSDGSIETIVTGGTPDYNFNWTLGGFTQSTDEDPTNLIAGNYTLILTDANGCEKIESTEITEPNAILLTPSSENSSCGNPDGSVNVTVDGGSVADDYTYSWYEVSTGFPGSLAGNTAFVNDLFSGNYNIVVEDDNSCKDSAQVAISDDNAPLISFDVIDVECFGDSTGEINLVVNGIEPFSFSWNGPNGFTNIIEDSISELISGSYTVEVTDGNLCTRTKNITVDGPVDGLSINNTVTPLSCNGDSTGAIDIQINGGSSPYQSIWTGPSGFSSNEQNISGLDTGYYSLVIIDNEGCQLTNNNFTVTQPDSIQIDATIIEPTCNQSDGSISVTSSGGTIYNNNNYDYIWDNLSTSEFSIGILPSLSDIGAGNYRVTAQDNEDCTSSKVFSIENVNAPELDVNVVNIDCFDNNNGSIDLTVNGSNSYSVEWDKDGVVFANDIESLSNLEGGTYSVTVTDLITGCVSVRSDDVVNPNPISIGSTVTNILCNGDNNGAIEIFISGGTGDLIANWTTIIPGNGIINSDTNQTGLSKGTYRIVVSDQNNCSDSVDFNIEEADTISISSNLTNVLCSYSLDGEISVIPSGGTGSLVPSWISSNPSFVDPSDFSLSNLDSGSYSLNILDDNNCNFDTTFVVEKPSAIYTSPSIDNISCNGNADGEIELNIIGGSGDHAVSWTYPDGTSSNEEIILTLGAGDYQLNVVDANNCSKDTTINILEPEPLVVSTDSVYNILCNGDNNGAIEVSFIGGTGDLIPNWTTIIPGNGIINSDTNQTGLSKGTYRIVVSDQNNCSDSVDFNIEEADTISISSNLTNVLCSYSLDGEISVIPSGGTGSLVPSWISSNPSFVDPSDFSLSNLDSGSYSLNILDDNNCNFDTTFVVEKPSAIYTSPSIDNISCNGNADGEIELNIIGGSSDHAVSWTYPDGASSNEEVILTLGAGDYQLNVVDANNCSKDTTINILEPEKISIVSSILNVACFGDSTGKINADISGGVSPYYYSWNDDSVYDENDSISNLTAGDYTLFVLDSNACAFDSLFTVNEANKIEISELTLVDNECFNDSLGEISLNTIGGTGIISYEWNSSSFENPINAEIISDLPSDTFLLSLSDSNLCRLDTFFVISSPNAINANITIFDANCGLSDGRAISLPFGGTTNTSNYTYSWENDISVEVSDSNSLNNQINGTYSLTITDDNECSLDTTFTILDTPGPSIVVNNVTSPTCFNSNDGEINLSINGGNKPYNIYWSPNSYSQDSLINNIGSGIYSIHVEDSVGCVKDSSINVSSPDEIITSISTENTSCGLCTGNATVSFSGGTGSLSPIWSNSVIGNSTNGLCSGIYSVEIYDETGCSVSKEFSISDQTSNITESIAIVPPTCNNSNNGSISVTVDGISSPSFLWLQNGATTNELEDISIGDYSVMITDDNGCSKTVLTTVVSESASIIVDATIVPSNCGESNGSISLNPSGGSIGVGSNYNYDWSNGEAGSSLIDYPSGVYSVTISDDNGCTFEGTYGIADFGNIDISLNVNNISCYYDNNGSINAITNGGNNISENWYNNAGANIGTGSSINNLSAGEYLYSIEENTCQQFSNASIENGNPLFVSLSNVTSSSCDISCDGSATVVVAGGKLPYSYSWNNGETTNTTSALCSGAHTVLITDSLGCEIQQNIWIDESNNLAFTSTVTDATCGACDGIATVNPIGGSGDYSVTWYNNVQSNSANNLCAGIYGITLKDNNTSCEIITEISVSNSSGPDNQTIITSDPTCYGGTDGSARVIASGGAPPYHYLWVPGGQTTDSISNIGAGNYYLEVIDTNNCILTVPVTLSSPEKPTVESIVMDANCLESDGSISIVVYGGAGSFNYEWTGPNSITSNEASIDNLEAGQYILKITDINGCAFNETFNVNSVNEFNINLESNNVGCFNDNDGNIISNLFPESDDYSYSWYNSNGDEIGTENAVNNLSAGNYSIIVTDDNTNCKASAYTNITQPDSISLSETIVVEPTCYGESNGQANIIPMGGNNLYNASWTHNGFVGFSQSNLSAGDYEVIITDLNECVSNQIVSIEQPDSININIVQVLDAYCQDQNDGEIAISITGGTGDYFFSWTDSSGTFSSSEEDIFNLFPGFYSVTVTDINNCYNSTDTIIGATNTIIANAGIDTNICIGSCIDLVGSFIGSGNVSYQWNVEDSSGVISSDSILTNYCFNSAENITFSLTVNDQNCSNTDSVTVYVNDLPLVDAGIDTSEIFGAEIPIGGLPTGPLGSSYSWTPTTNFVFLSDSSSSNPEIEVLSDITYLVTVTDSNGCINSDEINVRLIPEISYPSGFSPNNDGINDDWNINQIDQYPNCVVEIYNRWGVLLFKSPEGYTEKWSGNYNNKALPIGTYYYIIELNDPKFNEPITGPVTIIR